MSTEVLTPIITGLFTLAGVIITVIVGNRKYKDEITQQLKEQSNMTIYRLDLLEKKQDKHNNLIERMTVVEQSTKSAHHRIDHIEHAVENKQ